MVLALPLSACSDKAGEKGNTDAGTDGDAGKTYPLTFTCDVDAGAACPAGQTCPAVPLSSTSCGDIPANLGHDAIPQSTGRPIGCTAGLPYGNPFYTDMQVICVCMDFGGTRWVCAL
ncbi:MAG TPA: hypothetical protein VN903_25895 [Polyangia bacterium]|nr:hypothetical protein [Polyangia bacterium]